MLAFQFPLGSSLSAEPSAPERLHGSKPCRLAAVAAGSRALPDPCFGVAVQVSRHESTALSCESKRRHLTAIRCGRGTSVGCLSGCEPPARHSLSRRMLFSGTSDAAAAAISAAAATDACGALAGEADATAVAAASGSEAAGCPQVVLTREKGKNGKLLKALEARGISTVELPLIEHREGPDLPRLHQILKDVDGNFFAWVAITSPEAATVFIESWRAAGGSRPVRIVTVGGGTSEVFAKLPDEERKLLTIAFTPSKAIATSLAAELPAGQSEDERTVLYPASLKASTDLQNGLTARGFTVTRLNTYSTETTKALDEDALRQAAAAPVTTFASPTAVRAWMETVVPYGWDGAAACIGVTSANAAKKAGLTRVFYPDSPGIDGWVASVEQALEAMSHG